MALNGTCHQGVSNIFCENLLVNSRNYVMATIYATVFPVVQWKTKDLDGILHTGNRLYMTIHKTHEYLIVIDIGNAVTEYGQGYSIDICKRCLVFLLRKWTQLLI